jgi:hypothetical protein
VEEPLPDALGPLSQIKSPTTARTAAGPKKITRNCGNVIVSIFRVLRAVGDGALAVDLDVHQ